MLWLLNSLTGLSALLLLTGFVWVLVQKGTNTERHGAEAGKEVMAQRMGEDAETPIVHKTAFRGRAASTRREAVVSFHEIKRQLRQGQWKDVMPVLLAVGGLLGLLLFGSLALLAAMDDKLVGGIIAFVGLFSVVRVVIGLVRA